ncbi:MAG: ATP-binding cassette domain-containing protein, partial [Niameybacter sp.]
MIYLETFNFPDGDEEFDFILSIKRKCYDSFYPFKILSKNRFERIDFEHITILYGGNGSGKSTALNVIGEKLQLIRESIYNKSNFYQDYVDLCRMELVETIPEHSRIITSDDVFDYMLNIRTVNEGVDYKREALFEEYLDAKYANLRLRSMADYDQFKKMNESRSKTQSKYVRHNLMNNIREYSNGESAFMYFTEKI